MSHDKQEHDNIITVGQRAWHGLDDNRQVATLEDVRNDALNFQVFEKPMFYDFDGKNEEADHKVTYRKVNGKSIKLGEVGSGYTVLQNDQFCDLLKPIEDSGLATIETAGTLLNGRKVWVMFKLTSIEPVPGDKYDCYLVGFNSHDGSTSVGFCSTSIRIVCGNTWRAALDNRAAKILSARHTTNVLPNVTFLRDALDLVNGGFLATKEKLEQLAQITVQSEEQIRKVVKIAFSVKSLDIATFEAESVFKTKKALLEDIVNLYEHGKGQDIPGVKGTGLALFNAITEYTNHKTGSSRIKPSNADSRLNSVLFGPSAKINDRAAESILALAK